MRSLVKFKAAKQAGPAELDINFNIRRSEWRGHQLTVWVKCVPLGDLDQWIGPPQVGDPDHHVSFLVVFRRRWDGDIGNAAAANVLPPSRIAPLPKVWRMALCRRQVGQRQRLPGSADGCLPGTTPRRRRKFAQPATTDWFSNNP